MSDQDTIPEESNPIKQASNIASDTSEIPPDKLSEILTNEANKEALKPLIADVVSKAASIGGLREEITNLFKGKNDEDLNKVLQALQEKLNEIYNSSKGSTGGRKRRRTNKRKNYKKRRTTKRR